MATATVQGRMDPPTGYLNVDYGPHMINDVMIGPSSTTIMPDDHGNVRFEVPQGIVAVIDVYAGIGDKRLGQYTVTIPNKENIRLEELLPTKGA